MRFNNNTNIPNKIVQNAVNALKETDKNGLSVIKPAFAFTDAYGMTTTTYKVNIDGFPTIVIKDNGKFYNVSTTGNDKFYNIDADGKRILPEEKKIDENPKKKGKK